MNVEYRGRQAPMKKSIFITPVLPPIYPRLALGSTHIAWSDEKSHDSTNQRINKFMFMLKTSFQRYFSSSIEHNYWKSITMGCVLFENIYIYQRLSVSVYLFQVVAACIMIILAFYLQRSEVEMKNSNVLESSDVLLLFTRMFIMIKEKCNINEGWENKIIK